MTPKFLFGFFKWFYLTWGEWFKFFFKRTLTLKYFSLWQKFYLDSPKICLWSWRFLLFIWTQDKILFTWEMPFENLIEICTMAFGIILCHFQLFSLAMALVQTHSPNPTLIFGSCLASNPASWTSPMFTFHLNLIQINLCLLSYPSVLYKGTLLSVLIFAPKPTLLPSPLNPQPRSMKIHWSSVQIFQTILAASLDQICQIWWNSFKFFFKNSE